MVEAYFRYSWLAAIGLTIATGVALGHYEAMAIVAAYALTVYFAVAPIGAKTDTATATSRTRQPPVAASRPAGGILLPSMQSESPRVSESHRLDVRKVFYALAVVTCLASAACDDIVWSNEGEPAPCADGECPLSQALPLPLPTVDLPEETRCWNWGGGSCYHASIINVMRAQGLWELADWWRKSFAGAESTAALARKLDQAEVRFAVCATGDPAFLEWCNRTRRWAAITYKPNHAITFVGWNDRTVWLLDNNFPNRYEALPRAEFLARWRQQYGGQAVTVIYGPLPPPLNALDFET